MDKKFVLQFAFRNLMTHRLRSALTVAGMVIGISAIVFLVSFAFGVERIVTKEVSGTNAYELLDIGAGSSQIVRLDKDSINKIQDFEGVKEVATIINVVAKVKEIASAQNNTSVFGTTSEYLDWSGLSVREGDTFESPNLKLKNVNAKPAVVNTALLLALNKSSNQAIGSAITLDIIVPKSLTDKDQSVVTTDYPFEIVGVLEDDSSSAVYANEEILQSLGVENYSQAKAILRNQNQVDSVRKQIENLGFKTQYVGETVAQVEKVFSFFKLILGSFGLIALLVASLGMFNTLTISLLERMKEVALLKILGMKKRDISIIFLTESIIFGIFGGFIGIIIGFGLGGIISSIFNAYALRAGGNRIELFYAPLWFIIVMVAFSVGVGLLTGLYPSRRASRVAPLDVIRYE
ncbi:hypothetical protein A2215_04185 [Candidatus Berkelbacteria bacterium RIFOXYA2_FULL_43_10]|uniref:ABC3 transporter permease protein domain-containing protein n=1 Tax=Candidatus Berkelbacteria bacterium RIFOXYA2_FULL_43_10 TaxID=1797472 RepID=A0A1F5EA86_9BACT|nr:MAG: hypothetical protein A2215_04185 [Candidatus Berkelbacteria bacterium RIFOXYA2_FULL_43_10]